MNPESNDEVISDNDDGSVSVITAVNEYKREAEEARRDRLRKSKRNRDAAANMQDWSHKEEGQSAEFIPKTSTALETFSSFIKKATTKFGDWFSVSTGEESPLTGDEVRGLLKEFLRCIPTSMFSHNKTTIQHILSDGIKVGLLESLIIFKVHGYKTRKNVYNFEKGENSFKVEPWNLVIDLIPPENYMKDPTGRNLYEIHRVERDLIDVQRLAEQGVYDQEVVDKIVADFSLTELEETERDTEQDRDKTPPPSFRKRVVIDEFWGTLMDSSGKVIHENVFCSVANDTYLIRKPQPNPFWHGESPFVAGPLTRVPFSENHRALFDNVVPLNEAMNEMFNLMLDGGIASVWGINQIRPEYLEDTRQVSDGVSQGTTLVMNDSAPEGAKVFEQVSTGTLPPEAMAMYNLLDKEFNSGALTSEIKMGLLPTKEVKATEIVEASQSHAVTLDALVGDFEFYISQLLKKSWLTVVQNIDDVDLKMIDNSVGRKAAVILSRMTPQELFEAFGDTCQFKVFGLSATLARAQEFQKLMGIMAAIKDNPILLQAFHKKYSEEKILNQLMKMNNIDPETIERDAAEKQQMGQEMNDAAAMNEMGLTGKGTVSGQGGMAAAVNQQAEPTGGI